MALATPNATMRSATSDWTVATIVWNLSSKAGGGLFLMLFARGQNGHATIKGPLTCGFLGL
jgi:hypothetical protein